jgi:hypothetical protein
VISNGGSSMVVEHLWQTEFVPKVPWIAVLVERNK